MRCQSGAQSTFAKSFIQKTEMHSRICSPLRSFRAQWNHRPNLTEQEPCPCKLETGFAVASVPCSLVYSFPAPPKLLCLDISTAMSNHCTSLPLLAVVTRYKKSLWPKRVVGGRGARLFTVIQKRKPALPAGQKFNAKTRAQQTCRRLHR